MTGFHTPPPPAPPPPVYPHLRWCCPVRSSNSFKEPGRQDEARRAGRILKETASLSSSTNTTASDTQAQSALSTPHTLLTRPPTVRGRNGGERGGGGRGGGGGGGGGVTLSQPYTQSKWQTLIWSETLSVFSVCFPLLLFFYIVWKSCIQQTDKYNAYDGNLMLFDFIFFWAAVY